MNMYKAALLPGVPFACRSCTRRVCSVVERKLVGRFRVEPLERAARGEAHQGALQVASVSYTHLTLPTKA